MKKFNYDGNDYKVFKMDTGYGYDIDVIVVPRRYANNDTLAIEILEINEEGELEPWIDATVNLHGAEGGCQTDTRAFLDLNNGGATLLAFIGSNELAKPLPITKASGFCTYQLYEFDLKKIYADG